MRAKSASDLEGEWKGRNWYRRPARHSAEPSHPKDDLNLRLRRALSWLGRAEREYRARDFDAAFVFYWVAFNAAYGQRGSSQDEETRDREDWRRYLSGMLESVDSKGVIYDTIYADLRDPIEKMLQNRFAYESYWKFRNGVVGHKNWKRRFEEDAEAAKEAIKGGRTRRVLLTLFDRLYTLRNQLLHGGATWSSSVNRNQVEPGARIMSSLVPHFIDAMIDRPDADWGPPRYPVVRESGPQSGWKDGGA